MLEELLEETLGVIDRAAGNTGGAIRRSEIGVIDDVGHGIARVKGLPGAKYEELIRFPGGALGVALDLDPDEIGVALLDESADINAGARVHRTGRTVDTPVGYGLLGRVVDGAGRPLDERGLVDFLERRPVEKTAPPIINRAPVTVPLQTGLKVVDALVPIGRGQRELILGDRQTGKTAIAVDAMINQKDKGVICVYCAIGQRSSAVAKVVAALRSGGAMDSTLVVMAGGEDPPGLQFITPYAATAMAEYFMERGRDVLIVYDDLTRHARAYRELSLLLRRPPGREAYPGDIFYIHSRLLERSTHLREESGGGSLTALPIIETQAQNVAAYIPTNLISITDGQIYLSPELFQKGFFPAVDVGKSVSRVGGKAQLPGYLSVAGALRLSYSQFEEMETFARFGTRLDKATRETIERGRRVREALKQPQFSPLSACEQLISLTAVTEGVFDGIGLPSIAAAEKRIIDAVTKKAPEICEKIHDGGQITGEMKKKIIDIALETVKELS
ncbi:MAG: alternate F1F0 ATPase, F1 subunit alpha [Candidatus Nitrospinota bacterium M3_3B_026]